MQFPLADAVYAIYFYSAAAILFWMLWGNIDILVQKPVGLANLFSVKLCFVCVFPLFKFMLNKPNSVSKPVIKQEILFF